MTEAIRHFLSWAEPWFVRAFILSAIGGAACHVKRSFRSSKQIDAKYWLWGISIVLAGAWLRLRVMPFRHVVVFDEYAHLAIAATLKATGRLCDIKMGTLSEPEICSLPLWPSGYHTVLAALFDLTGPSETAAFWFSAAVGLLSIPLIFWTSVEEWGIPWVGIFSAAFLAVSRVHLLFSAATETCLLSSFLVLATLWGVTVQRRFPGMAGNWLLFGLAGWAMLVRSENALLSILVPFSLWTERRKIPWFNAWALLLICAGAAFLSRGWFFGFHGTLASYQWRLPITLMTKIHYWISGAYRPQLPATTHPVTGRAMGAGARPGTTHPGKMSWSSWLSLYWSVSRFNEPIILILFLIGAYRSLKEGKSRWLLVWVLSYMVLYEAVLPAPLSASIDATRFSLNLIPPYLLVSGFGAAHFLGQIQNRAIRAGLVAFCGIFLLYRARAGAEELWDRSLAGAEAGRILFQRSGKALSPDAYFVSYMPSYVACLSDRKVVLPDFIDQVKGPMVLSKDMAWYIMRRQYGAAGQEALFRNYSFRRLDILRPGRPEGPDNYSIYLLEPKTAVLSKVQRH